MGWGVRVDGVQHGGDVWMWWVVMMRELARFFVCRRGAESSESVIRQRIAKVPENCTVGRAHPRNCFQALSL
eukprot:6835419-Prorocentrum_lima.AAC.1